MLRALHSAATQLTRRLLPPRCILCGVHSMDADLCPACIAELPRNDACCARCALPLAAPMVTCGVCQRRPPPWAAAWAPFRYGWPLGQLEASYKYSGNLAAGHVLARLWSTLPPPLQLPQAIIPVPLHVSRLRRRGYNQSLELAKPLAEVWHLPLLLDVLQRTRATDAQTTLDAKARRRNVRGAFTVDARSSLPSHIAVLDDVMTTGATLNECVRVLKRAGVERVDVWALARAPSPRD